MASFFIDILIGFLKQFKYSKFVEDKRTVKIAKQLKNLLSYFNLLIKHWILFEHSIVSKKLHYQRLFSLNLLFCLQCEQYVWES
ncbi:hypothetical protein SALLE_v1c11460 [Spiroplasma alleghenense]|uniref:Uncharacterized protein n=1 Tax=Spiroplasma alleghenense TaxID=216931 RepID=A0A345Z5D7_9MOLU|nr:hypothetical protein SALLE_v1c11460 [Spiroplasma alleghenense]